MNGGAFILHLWVMGFNLGSVNCIGDFYGQLFAFSDELERIGSCCDYYQHVVYVVLNPVLSASGFIPVCFVLELLKCIRSGVQRLDAGIANLHSTRSRFKFNQLAFVYDELGDVCIDHPSVDGLSCGSK